MLESRQPEIERRRTRGVGVSLPIAKRGHRVQASRGKWSRRSLGSRNRVSPLTRERLMERCRCAVGWVAANQGGTTEGHPLSPLSGRGFLFLSVRWRVTRIARIRKEMRGDSRNSADRESKRVMLWHCRKRYQPGTIEPQLQALWQASGLYHFDPELAGPVYSIDTPPPTVSGHLHLGHVYSYSQTDFMARFCGCAVTLPVFYPMG